MEEKFKLLILTKYMECPKGWFAWLNSKQNKYLLDALNKEFPQLSSIAEKIYWLKNNLTDYPICPTCGTKIMNFGKHRSNFGSRFCYQKYCCAKCAASNKDTQIKRRTTCELLYNDPTYNNPDKTTATCKERYNSGRNTEAIQKTMLEKFGVASYLASNEINSNRNSQEIQEKIQETKRKNHTFNSSKIEDDYYNYLCTLYSKDDIIRQYKDERYPFNCDFYIKSIDTFIELNLNWTHGSHPFDKSSNIDLLKLHIMQEKAITSKFYKNAIEVWTKRDPNKLAIAKANNLNYIMIYKDGEFYENSSIKQ